MKERKKERKKEGKKNEGKKKERKKLYAGQKICASAHKGMKISVFMEFEKGIRLFVEIKKSS